MRIRWLAAFAFVLGACSKGSTPTATNSTTTTTTTHAIKINPCSTTGTLTLASSQATRIDCGNGGTTLTLAGNGASYLIVPQFATDQATFQFVPYTMYTGSTAAASVSASRVAAAGRFVPNVSGGLNASAGLLPPRRPRQAQLAADRALRARARQRMQSSTFRASLSRASGAPVRAAVQPPPAAGSIKSFHVANSFTVNTWATIAAKLAYVGTNVLVYIDTMAPANGFTPAQLTSFGQLFDQTMYPIDTAAFGAPSDIDNNGRVIMLMSPVVNADSPKSTCATIGYVAGFFDETDFNGPSDPNSNQAEIFYTIVPDPTGTVSCTHTVADLGLDVPATFLHELQHLISFSQHVVVAGGNPGASWLDEGLSLVAEELGSVYYEQKCPPPACRTSSAQLFPDSAQGFVQSFLYDSYSYALLPDTSSITLSDDGSNGFGWRGGAWLLARYLGDQMGSGFYKKLERGSSDGVTAIETATGQSFPSLFANLGLALYTDSLPGLPRTTAPAVNRFTSRNVKALWGRLFATSGPSTSFPTASPVQLFAITTDTTVSVMMPGTMTYFRLDTPATAATVTIQFAAPGSAPFLATLRPQMAVFRLPAGQ
jgi:hypothetical protein